RRIRLRRRRRHPARAQGRHAPPRARLARRRRCAGAHLRLAGVPDRSGRGAALRGAGARAEAEDCVTCADVESSRSKESNMFNVSSRPVVPGFNVQVPGFRVPLPRGGEGAGYPPADMNAYALRIAPDLAATPDSLPWYRLPAFLNMRI